ncbi:MAG: hypothetical protein Tsb0016_18640 [Sphingomonadales bacterium]
MSNQKVDYFITKPMEIVSLACLGTIGNLAAFALPVIVGGLVDHMALDTRAAGYLGTMEMIGLGLGAMLFSGVILKMSWRQFALIAVFLVAAANIATPYAFDTISLYAARLVSGLGGGMLLALGAAGLSSTRSPERVIGSVAIASMLFAGVVLYAFPLLLKQWGLTTMFFTIAGLNIFLSLLVFKLPRKSPYVAAMESKQAVDEKAANEAAQKPVKPVRPPLLLSISTLSGIFLFFTGAMAFWVYIERVGVASSFATEQIATVLGLSQVFGALGALLAVLIATKLGNRLAPMAFCIVLAVICALLVTLEPSVLVYGIAACGFILAWDFLYPYLMGVSIALDPSAKLVSYSLALQTIGKSLGPTLAALLIIGTDFSGAYWMCFGLFAASLVCLLPAILHTDKRLKAPNPESQGQDVLATS